MLGIDGSKIDEHSADVLFGVFDFGGMEYSPGLSYSIGW